MFVSKNTIDTLSMLLYSQKLIERFILIRYITHKTDGETNENLEMAEKREKYILRSFYN